MSTLFFDLCQFFGITTVTPTNFGEFIPWAFQVFLAIGLFLFVMSHLFSYVRGLGRGSY